jgi:putative SOS response-associated peptidase YedK
MQYIVRLTTMRGCAQNVHAHDRREVVVQPVLLNSLALAKDESTQQYSQKPDEEHLVRVMERKRLETRQAKGYIGNVQTEKRVAMRV